MEVTKGYKQTEVGFIPEDWETKSLAEIGNFRTGPFGTLLKANEYYADEGVPLVSVRDIKEGKLAFNEHTPLVPLPVVRRLPEYVLHSGDIVFGRKGGVDRSAIVQESQSGCFLGSDGIRIRPSKNYYPLFITYQLQRKQVQSWLLQNATGTTMPSMNQTILRRISLPIPPTLAEQEAIAEALSDADALIEALEQLLAKKRQVKQGVMQELLTGKRRLPGFNETWEEIRLGDMLDFERPDKYIVESTDYLDVGNVPVLTANKSFILGYTDEDFGIFRDLPVIIFDDFTTDKKFVDFPFKVKSSAIKILKPKNHKVNLRFVFEKMQLVRFSIGDHKRYYISEYQHLQIPMPDIEEQTAIAEILSDMDAEIAALEAKLAKARQVKQGMMSELLTGRIRLV